LPRRIIDSFLRHICWLSGSSSEGESDGTLLDRFVAARDEAAFNALLARHGPLVLGVCRRALGDGPDAEDAFQATFLLLVRKAGSVRRSTSVGPWLYGVARHVALKARRGIDRRRARERLAPPPAPAAGTDEADRRDLRRVLDEELGRLPEKYRATLVLCYLEGKSHEQAAGELGWPNGTVCGRLARAREMLRGRLLRRGVTLSAAGLLAEQAGSASATIPPALAEATLQSARHVRFGSGALSPRVAALLREGMQAMFLSKVKTVVGVVLALTLLAAGLGLAVLAGRPAPPSGPPPAAQPSGEKKDVDLGGPLSPGAVARLGTTRFRHGGAVNDVAFSPGGRLIASAGTDGAVRVWEATTGKEVLTLSGHQQGPSAVAISPDGKTLASADLGQVLLWDLATGKRLPSPERTGPAAIARLTFSPDGRLLAWCGADRTIRLWGLAAGKEVRRIDGPDVSAEMFARGAAMEGGFLDLSFSPDGKSLAAAFWDGRGYLYEVSTGKRLRRFGGPARGDRIARLAFAPDGRALVTGGAEDPLILWDVATGKKSRALGDKPAQVWSVALSPDGKVAAAGNSVGGITAWDLQTGRQRFHVVGPRGTVTCLAFSPDSRHLAAGGQNGSVRVVDAIRGRPLDPASGHRDRLLSVCFSPDGRTVATGGDDDTVRLWDPSTGRERRRLEKPGDKDCSNAVFSPDGKVLATWGRTPAWDEGDPCIRLWDPATGKELRTLACPDGFVNGIAFSPDGKSLAARCSDNAVRVWDFAGGKKLATLEHNDYVTGAAFSPDGMTFATSTEGLALRFWDARTWRQRWQLTKQPGLHTLMGFLPDGHSLVARDVAGRLSLWETGTGGERLRWPPPAKVGHAVALSTDGKLLASGEGNAISVRELATGKELCRLLGHRDAIHGLAFSPDARRLASASWDTTALVWDVSDVRPERPGGAVASDDLNSLWDDLAGADAARAHQAILHLSRSPGRAVPFLARRLRPVAAADAQRVARLIAELDSQEPAVRERAARELAALAELAEEALRRALANEVSAEVQRRCRELLRALQGPVRQKETLRALRALEVLEEARTPEVVRVIRQLAGGVPESRVTRAARAALARLGPAADVRP
jgi:RNA polymerase sigma factor (sigma-70 family)